MKDNLVSFILLTHYLLISQLQVKGANLMKTIIFKWLKLFVPWQIFVCISKLNVT
jgi:hypothetical protein